MSYIPFEPVIEDETERGAFLVDDPRKLLSRNSDIPWITGLCSADGGFLALSKVFIFFVCVWVCVYVVQVDGQKFLLFRKSSS